MLRPKYIYIFLVLLLYSTSFSDYLLKAHMFEFQTSTTTNTGEGIFGTCNQKGSLDSIPANNGFDSKEKRFANYFKAHLKFVKNYFSAMSNNNIKIDFEVEEKIYKLPEKMVHYRPAFKISTESNLEYAYRLSAGIMAFAMNTMDTIIANDSNTSKSDSIIHIMFHAGASGILDGGGTSALADSPVDIIDSYISLDDFLDYNSLEYWDGVKNTTLYFDSTLTSYFPNGIVICSEIGGQDGTTWGINGILVNQICRAMGAPDLFNTNPESNGATAMGAFCLMDVYGYNAGSGFIPTLPSAWVRELLGSFPTRSINPGQDTMLNISSMSPSSLGPIKVNISSTEYYLIEHRRKNKTDSIYIFCDTTFGRDTTKLLAKFTYHIDSFPRYFTEDSLYNKDDNLVYNPLHGRGIVQSASEYDIGIPGTGALVWHIDKKIISDNLKTNSINADITRRGVDIEEADGIEDIGVPFSGILGTVYDLGGYNDFFPNTSIDTTATPSKKKYVSTFTKTNTNYGAWTGLSITIDTIKTLDTTWAKDFTWSKYFVNYNCDSLKVSIDWGFSQSGNWPIFADSLAGKSSILFFDTTILVFSPSGNILGFSPNNGLRYTDKLFTGNSKIKTKFSASNSFAVFAHSDSAFLYQHKPLQDSANRNIKLLNLTAPPTTDILFCSDSIIILGLADSTLIKVKLPNTIILETKQLQSVPLALAYKDSLIYCANEDIQILKLQDLQTIEILTSPLDTTIINVIVANISRDSNGDEVLICDNLGNISLLSSSLNTLSGWPIKTDANYTLPSIGDIDGDKSLDIIFGGENKVYCYNYTASLLEGWPKDLSFSNNFGSYKSGISIYDVNKNGKAELFAPSPDGNLRITTNTGNDYQFESGNIQFAKPFSLGSGSGTSVAIENIDADSNMEFFTVNDSGWIYCYELPAITEKNIQWATYGNSYTRTFAYADSLLENSSSSLEVSINRFDAYPNPSFGVSFSVFYTLSTTMKNVELTLYNAAGKKLKELKNLPNNSGSNTYKINVQNYAPGIYLVKLAVENGTERTIKFTKIGLIR